MWPGLRRMTVILLAIDKTMRMTMTMTKGGNSGYNSRNNDRDSVVVVNSELLRVGQERGQDRRRTGQDKTRQPLWVTGQPSGPIEAKRTLGRTIGHNGRFMTLTPSPRTE